MQQTATATADFSRYNIKMKENIRIIKLLQDFEFVNPELGKIIQSLRETILIIAPKSEEKVMYGGIIFKIPGRMFCGLFLRKKHISIEFDLGFLLKDKNEFLEGTGKFRRHLKIKNKEEIKTKMVEKFIKECFNLKT
ncbi:MAG: DUF1801 domain-containing protein [Bacteroidetes bacterium]|nr:DUF1801 domain-containing protein [Bacteroidota bacterium]